MVEVCLPFTAEHMVIITSNDEIEAQQWRQYLVTNWARLTRKNSKVLILAGIHGHENGQIGPVDEGLLDDNQRQIRVLKRKLSNEIKENNIDIILEDVAEHMDRSKLNEKKLAKAIKDHDPTLVILGFCYTSVSELNDILRGEGIYTFLIMQENHAKITESKYVTLDPIQRKIVESIAENKPANVFVWGSHGTGKTLILTQALEMKISQYKREGKPINVIISSFMANSDKFQLMKDFQIQYLSNIVGKNNVRFISIFELCIELGLELTPKDPQAKINSVINSLAASECHTIILVDEVPASSGGDQGADWSNIQTEDNVDYLVALSPYGGDDKTLFDVIPPPESTTTLSQRLLYQHRNCGEIRQMLLYFINHIGTGYLSPSEDQMIDSDLLPKGRLPVWIERTEEVDDVEILEMLKKDHIMDGETVTVIHKMNKPNDGGAAWCEVQGWRYLDNYVVTGIEDQCVIIISDGIQFESFTRGRNLLVMVTTRGKEDLLLPVTLAHTDKNYQCPLFPNCIYTGKAIICRQRIGNEELHRVWDEKEEVRQALRKVVKIVVGDEYLHYMHKFLECDEIMDTIKLYHASTNSDRKNELTIKLAGLILNKRDKFEMDKLREEVRPMLMAIPYFLGSDYAKGDYYVPKLLQNEEIVTTAKLCKTSEEKGDMEIADHFGVKMFKLVAKQLGNESFQTRDYPKACQYYTDALKQIKFQPTDSRILSNRAACHYEMGEFKLCIKDCNESISMDPMFVKPTLRKANALKSLGNIEEALNVYIRVVELEPACEEARRMLEQIHAGFKANVK